jgi:hypothetical protein
MGPPITAPDERRSPVENSVKPRETYDFFSTKTYGYTAHRKRNTRHWLLLANAPKFLELQY